MTSSDSDTILLIVNGPSHLRCSFDDFPGSTLGTNQYTESPSLRSLFLRKEMAGSLMCKAVFWILHMASIMRWYFPRRSWTYLDQETPSFRCSGKTRSTGITGECPKTASYGLMPVILLRVALYAKTATGSLAVQSVGSNL